MVWVCRTLRGHCIHRDKSSLDGDAARSREITLRKLTRDESIGLPLRYNLADAHVRHRPSESEDTHIIARLPELFRHAGTLTPGEADEMGAMAFARLSCQRLDRSDWWLPVYASSISMEIVANVLRAAGINVGLIEPTFDNIPDILKRHGIPLQTARLSLRSSYLESLAESAAKLARGSALFIVNPNNPTGDALTRRDFEQLCYLCSSRGICLIVDSSFRLFDESCCYDQYAVLDHHDVDYICIEDTGKIWPSLDVKLSYLRASARWRLPLREVYDDYMLNVSPFVSLLVEAFSSLYIDQGRRRLRRIVTRNRDRLRALLAETPVGLEVPYVESAVSVEVLQLPEGRSADEAVVRLRDGGVGALSARAFFWSDPDRGRDLLRIALARDPDRFDAGVKRLLELVVAR